MPGKDVWAEGQGSLIQPPNSKRECTLAATIQWTVELACRSPQAQGRVGPLNQASSGHGYYRTPVIQNPKWVAGLANCVTDTRP